MLQLTKIFPFETAHAVYGYDGPCRNIHGHSYELHVTVVATVSGEQFLPPPGFLIDFKDIKKIVKSEIVDYFDHKLLLSKTYLEAHPEIGAHDNLIVWEQDRKSTRLNSSHVKISYAVFCLKKKKKHNDKPWNQINSLR